MGQLDDCGKREDLALYRLQTAKSDLKSARILLAAENYKGIIVKVDEILTGTIVPFSCWFTKKL